MWEAFGGREETLRAPAQKVRRVTLYLQAQNEHEYELQQEQQEQIEEAERKARQGGN